ncbi:hypothetical protein RF11_00300 [Thelohanellus kitauei]|uniref:Uncharacterized protein n=1 Tax=Thelohanellus kitauei TaxID=669202 RepID=A0A0C2NE06_THEKT|nr:hypothetical protein RF11_00300 [Thelohanellus kitauei]
MASKDRRSTFIENSSRRSEAVTSEFEYSKIPGTIFDKPTSTRSANIVAELWDKKNEPFIQSRRELSVDAKNEQFTKYSKKEKFKEFMLCLFRVYQRYNQDDVILERAFQIYLDVLKQ